MDPPVGVYIHVPYCRVACPYCDFVKKPLAGEAPAGFADAVRKEIEAFQGPRAAQSIFFGGGTPSLLSAESLETILQAVRDCFSFDASPEISIEVNPDDVTVDRANTWRSLGINRISLGVQAFDDGILKYLGRCHTAETARKACGIVAERFENWGIDLIFGARPVESWQSSLNEAVGFGPPHISTYSLTFEERTPFWKRRSEAIDDDLSLGLYREAMDRLGKAGFGHYEVSNFAKPGFECAHNRIYWRNEPYAGFGPGAYSYIDGVRMRNHPGIDRYLSRPGEKSEELVLSQQEIRIETLIQHFRTQSGISRAYYRSRFGAELDEDFGPALTVLKSRELLADDGKRIFPTQTGYELNDEIGLALVARAESEAVQPPASASALR